jgi:hypothetical protein
MPERSNLFESHWSNQWLTQKRVTEARTRMIQCGRRRRLLLEAP